MKSVPAIVVAVALCGMSLNQPIWSQTGSPKAIVVSSVDAVDMNRRPGGQEFPLYPGVAPGSENAKQVESEAIMARIQTVLTYNITRPTLTVFFPSPERAVGTAIIIAPGGGNMFLEMDNEGREVAQYLANRGLTAFVLKYRTREMPAKSEDFLKAVDDFLAAPRESAAPPSSAMPRPPSRELGIADGRQAVKVVRGFASKWGYAADRIGLMGFSAGAGVTWGTTTTAGPGEMPNFIGPIYGSLPAETPIPDNAPPLFLAAAADDGIAAGMPVTFARWIAAGLPAEIHIYAKGGHGFGMFNRGNPTDQWIEDFYRWLETMGLLAPQKR